MSVKGEAKKINVNSDFKIKINKSKLKPGLQTINEMRESIENFDH